jgi:hypothetical protein
MYSGRYLMPFFVLGNVVAVDRPGILDHYTILLSPLILPIRMQASRCTKKNRMAVQISFIIYFYP